MPLAWCPPFDGSGAAAVPWLGVTAAELVPDEAVVVGVVSAVAVPISDAPTAPPAMVEPTSAAPMTAFRMGFIVSPLSWAPVGAAGRDCGSYLRGRLGPGKRDRRIQPL